MVRVARSAMKKRVNHHEYFQRIYLRYLYVLILATAILSGFAIYAFMSNASAGTDEWHISEARTIEGGKFEASGVANINGTDGVLFIDDNQPGKAFRMLLDKDGKQTGPLKTIELGVNIEDPEGITTEGNYFYIVGSQSRPKGATQAGIARFRFDSANQRAEEVETISELKRFLIENVNEFRGMSRLKAKKDGINIEGLAWDSKGNRLLLGLRSPLAGTQALIVPLKLRDPRGPFSYENLDVNESGVIRLSLGGQGIRSLEYDERSKLFHIITGATESQEKTDFKLWTWDGNADRPTLQTVATFDRKLKPEGITRVSAAGGQFTFVVCDTGRYLKMD